MVTLPGGRRYRVRARTGWPGASVLRPVSISNDDNLPERRKDIPSNETKLLVPLPGEPLATSVYGNR